LFGDPDTFDSGRSSKNVYRYPTCLFKVTVSLSTVSLVKPSEVMTIFGCTSSTQQVTASFVERP